MKRVIKKKKIEEEEEAKRHTQANSYPNDNEILVCNQKYNIRNLEFESHQISSRLFSLRFLFSCFDRQQKLCQKQ